jgi:hypothetical protein
MSVLELFGYLALGFVMGYVAHALLVMFCDRYL